MKDIKDLVLIHVHAEGYRSGAVKDCAVVVEKSFHEKWKDDYNSVWFHELDGKHSEQEGEVVFTEINEENLTKVLESFYQAEDDDYYIWEQMMDDIWEEADVECQIKVNQEFCKRTSKKTVTKYYLDGKEL